MYEREREREGDARIIKRRSAGCRLKREIKNVGNWCRDIYVVRLRDSTPQGDLETSTYTWNFRRSFELSGLGKREKEKKREECALEDSLIEMRGNKCRESLLDDNLILDRKRIQTSFPSAIPCALYRKGACFVSENIWPRNVLRLKNLLSNFSQSCMMKDARGYAYFFFKSPSCLRFRRESEKLINFRSRGLAAPTVPEKFSDVINVLLAEAVTLISAGRSRYFSAA